ncbi:putative Malectin domain-containing protein [Helianthus annuus]|nr:putative Malectin domain-containing protein [Helianthus annuus]
MLTGEIPSNIITPQLRALDISFNSITGNLPANFAKIERSLNVVGTLVNGDGLLDGKASEISRCLLNDNKCIEKVPISKFFRYQCGGSQQISSYRITFDDDSEILGASSIYTSSNNHWAVSNTGSFISNPNGPQYTTQTASQITGTLDSELYKTARVSPNSLRYYGLGLRMEDIMLNFIFLKYKWMILSRGEALENAYSTFISRVKELCKIST